MGGPFELLRTFPPISLRQIYAIHKRFNKEYELKILIYSCILLKIENIENIFCDLINTFLLCKFDSLQLSS